MFIAVNFPPRTAFAASHTFWYVVFLINSHVRHCCWSSDHSLFWFLEEPPQIPISYPSIVHRVPRKVISRNTARPTFYSAGFLHGDCFLQAPLNRVSRFWDLIPSSVLIVDTPSYKTASSFDVAILHLVIVICWLPGLSSTFIADSGSWCMVFSFLYLDTIHHTLLHTSHILAPSLVLATIPHNSISDIHFSFWLS